MNTYHRISTNSTDSHQPTSTHQQLPPTTSIGQHQASNTHQQSLPPITSIVQHQASSTHQQSLPPITSIVQHQASSTHQQAAPTTSIVQPLMSVMGVAPLMRSTNVNSNNSGPPPPGKPPTPPHTADPRASSKDNHPIGDRLRRISESANNRSRDQDMRDTLIQKLGDVIQCLQVW